MKCKHQGSYKVAGCPPIDNKEGFREIRICSGCNRIFIQEIKGSYIINETDI